MRTVPSLWAFCDRYRNGSNQTQGCWVDARLHHNSCYSRMPTINKQQHTTKFIYNVKTCSQHTNRTKLQFSSVDTLWTSLKLIRSAVKRAEHCQHARSEQVIQSTNQQWWCGLRSANQQWLYQPDENINYTLNITYTRRRRNNTSKQQQAHTCKLTV